MRLVFVGSSFFSCIFLLTLLQAKFTVVAIFTTFVYYHRAFKKFYLTIEDIAFMFNIPVYHTSFLLNFFCFQLFYNLQIDYIILASCAFFFPPKLLMLPRYGTLNIHMSILPRTTGSNPIIYIFFLKDSMSGISISFITSKVDFGPIASILFVNIRLNYNYFFFHNYLSFLCVLFLLKYFIFFMYCCTYFIFFLKGNECGISTRKLLFSCCLKKI